VSLEKLAWVARSFVPSGKQEIKEHEAMSRIGKLPIEITKGVKLDYSDSVLSVQGPNGKLARQIIQDRYEGHIVSLKGDGFLTLFGYPTAHEEDAVRAVRSGLEIVTAVSQLVYTPPLQVRIGIHTGRVLAGNIGSPDRLSWTLVGDPVNVASRLQGLNKDFGSDILLSAETARRLEAPANLEPLSAVTVKGKATAVEVYRVV
jgi:hypothetical protein